MVCLVISQASAKTDTGSVEAFIENYVWYPTFHIFSHLAAVDETRLDDVAIGHVLEELYWLMSMFLSEQQQPIRDRDAN